MKCVPRLAAVLAAFAAMTASAQDVDRLTVGVQPDGRIVVPTNQILQPAGTQVTFPGRPVDLLLIEDGRTLAVKNTKDLVFIDVATGRVKQTLPTPGSGRTQPGFGVVGLAAAGARIFASDALHSVRVARRGADGKYAWVESLTVPPAPVSTTRSGKEPHPAGLAMLADGKLAVAATRGDCVHFFDTAGKVAQTVPVGVAPYAVLPVGPDRLYVSNWGGDAPKP